MSGKKIKKDIRNKELHPTRVIEYDGPDGEKISYIAPVNVQYENKGLYRKNHVRKRHVENPNIYEGDEPLRCGTRNIRLPKKKRKTAWKRFHKAFPYIKVTKRGQIVYLPEKDKKS